MRRIVLFIFALAVVASGFSQKLNHSKQKMVSSVVFTEYNSAGKTVKETKVSYGYDNERKLCTIVVYCENESITVSKRNGKIYSDAYTYKVNERGYILLKEDKYKIMDVQFKKQTRYYYDVNDKGMILKRVSRHRYAFDDGKWEASPDIFYINFEYWDGNCFWSTMHSSSLNIHNRTDFYGGEVKYDEEKYSNIKNDTNINPNLFLSMLCWEICLDAHEFELSSEWCGMPSANILRHQGGYDMEVEFDDRGNISEIYAIYKNRGVFYKLSIDYVY